MLIVGSSLARAFGIVGVASLIRYRTKIDDPKDAVVMLACLTVGLACGVGLYGLAVFATLFILAVLWIVESLEPEQRKTFELKITAAGPVGAARRHRGDPAALRHQVRAAQRRRQGSGLRGRAADATCAPIGSPTPSCCCSRGGETEVTWEEKKKK